MKLRCATLKMRIDSAARSLAYSPSGHHLVVGLGGDRDAMVKEGAVVVLSASTLEILEEVYTVGMGALHDGYLQKRADCCNIAFVCFCCTAQDNCRSCSSDSHPPSAPAS